ncbi:beta-glucosidase 13-like isoform X1 [Dioscorea cayenensis subsp. rotundata]|uniref:Beta-glucosidase 13-like isoform X1 n=1 Tax=Dioscorea cayennensis subsp. rotundata TaxID=55577 RepID=A0AB40BCP9_DIOCR|nr:beta-glucosidase 13-like isoform X1 [Dioscorea cayenensis subsp. rotundata]
MALLTITSCPSLTSSSNSKFSFLNNGRRVSVMGKPLLPCVHRKTSSPLACIKNINEEAEASEVVPTDTLRAKNFPYGFIFGTGSAAYQVEGAVNVGGRLPSIWDTFVHEQPDKIKDRSTGDVACDQYHRYKEDVKLLKDAGLDAFRFSISWPRILPKGTLKGGVNKEGIEHYNNLINELLLNGIKPFVTLFHWDVPQELTKYGGFLDSRIIEDFKDYCEVCFREFGDRVKFWTTINEPYIFTVLGYGIGELAPGRNTSSGGDSATEPYRVGHNLILAHAHVVKLYREKFQDNQRGEIGISLPSPWMKPLTNSIENIQARERGLEFMLGWFMEPLVHGDYPFIMKALVRDRLPSFTEEESKMIKGSYDFIGINYYTACFASNVPIKPNEKPVSVDADSHVEFRVSNLNGEPIGELTADKTTYICPEGIRDLLLYIKNKYNDPVIYITENGISQNEDGKLTIQEGLNDEERIKYHTLHLIKLEEAIRLGVKVKGYFTWSVLDDFEWSSGYTKRFGLIYIDFKDGLKRYPKASLAWFNMFLKS